MGNGIGRDVKEGFQKQEHQGESILYQVSRKGVQPVAGQFDIQQFFLKHCAKEEAAHLFDLPKPQEEEKQPIITTTAADCQGLHQEGPFQIHNPEVYPFSAVGLVYSRRKHFPVVGSGCLIGPNLVLTCAHNIYQAKTKDWHTTIQFVPSVIQNEMPMTGYKVKRCYIPQKYLKMDPTKQSKYNDGFLYDYAILQLDTDENLQTYFGSFGYDFDWQNSTGSEHLLREDKIIEEVSLVGYKVYGNRVQFSQYRGSTHRNANFLVYSMKTDRGLSGAPVFVKKGQFYDILAIHQRDVSDIIQGTSQIKQKAGLKLRFKMFEDINGNFKSSSHYYDLEKNKIQAHILPKVLQKILLTESQKIEDSASLSLNFTDNALGDGGCQLLSKISLTNLQQIRLWGNQITEVGCQHLANTRWKHLNSLSLKNNLIGDLGIQVLIKADWPYLEKLDLWDCHIKDKGCEHLSQCKWTQLRTLNLRSNSIQNGCEYLVKAPWKYLTDLNLRNNKIADEGCMWLSKVDWKHLQQLNLRGNLIGNQGCLSLQKGRWIQLMTLDLMGNKSLTREVIDGFKQKDPKMDIFWDNLVKGKQTGRNYNSSFY